MARMSALLAVLLGWVRSGGGRVERRVCLFEQFWIETENEIMRKEIETEIETEEESKTKTTIETGSTAETTIETEKEHSTSYLNMINVLHKTPSQFHIENENPTRKLGSNADSKVHSAASSDRLDQSKLRSLHERVRSLGSPAPSHLLLSPSSRLSYYHHRRRKKTNQSNHR